MRLISLLVCLPVVVAAQDAREIVRRAVEADHSDAVIARHYTYLEHQERRETDGAGKTKNVESQTWDVTLLEGSPYRRLIARNERPLSEKEQKKEDEKLRIGNEQRRRETPEQRQARIADWDRRQQQRREPVKELPDAFNFTLLREEAINGGQAYVIDAMPRPGYRPKLASAAFFPKVKARLWIDKRDYRWIKADIESIETVSFGGVVLRMAKGSRLVLEQEHVNNEVWLPRLVSFQGAFRILLVKGYRGEFNITFRDYKKFQADSRVIVAQ